MKKRNLIVAAILAMTAVAGCGVNTPPLDPPTEQETATADVTPAQEPAAEGQTTDLGMTDSWKEITEEEANGLIPRLFKAPDGAEVRDWTVLEDTSAVNGETDSPMVQLNFALDGMEFNARAQVTGDDYLDLSGCYYEWTVQDDVTMFNWGGGNMKGKMFRSIHDNGMTDLITWYDQEIGISYSLSVVAADLDGFDIQAVAEQMYSLDNEVFQGPPLYEDTDFATGLIETELTDMLTEAYGENAAEVKVTVDKIYDEAAMAAGELPDFVEIDRNAAAFEVSVEVKPADGAGEDAIMLLTVPDGVYDEPSGWVKEIQRLGVLRYTGSGYEITDLGTGW